MRPEWWDWEIELSAHLLERMFDRSFDELDLRRMLDGAHRIRRDIVPGRWLIQSRLRGAKWEIVVEPDTREQIVVVISAYPIAS